MKTIETLVPDILGLFTDAKLDLNPETVVGFSSALADKISSRVSEERGAPQLRLSNLGTTCDRELWYKINTPEDAEPLTPETRMKFLFGDILEEMLLYLAREAGHTVEAEQEAVDLHGISGHIDAIIDGHLVDVKSASTYSFDRFRAGLNPETDSFGYLTQLDGYMHALDLPAGAFLVVDKQLGRLCLDVHPRSNIDYSKVVANKIKMLESSEPPPRGYKPEPDGKSGNMKLGVKCSYCSFKSKCWPQLRTFLYFNGPRYLVVVKREPDVAER